MKALKSLMGVALVVGGFYVAWMLIPPYFYSYQFEDFINSEARLNSYNNKPEEEIRNNLVKKAQELGLPVGPEQIQVERMGATLNISAEYTIHVDLPLYPLDLRFKPSSSNKRM